MKRVLLYDIEGVFLVVGCDSGVVYQNQVAGNVRFQAEQVGVLVPLDVDDASVKLIEEWPFAQGGRGIDSRTADFLDGIFQSSLGTAFLSVDRTRLDECLEAWIHVEISAVPDEWTADKDRTYFGPIYGFEAGKGVVTWPNSD